MHKSSYVAYNTRSGLGSLKAVRTHVKRKPQSKGDVTRERKQLKGYGFNAIKGRIGLKFQRGRSFSIQIVLSMSHC